MDRLGGKSWWLLGMALVVGLLVTLVGAVFLSPGGPLSAGAIAAMGACAGGGGVVGAVLSRSRGFSRPEASGSGAASTPSSSLVASSTQPGLQALCSMAEHLPFMVWLSGPDSLGEFFNGEWRRFRGRTLGQERGQGWIAGLHSDDRVRCVDRYTSAFKARQPYEVIFRLQNEAGEFRWVFARGDQLRDLTGKFIGYITCCLDVTERREFEVALRENGREAEEPSRRLKTLSTQLLNAQEAERRRLSRELHDTIGQDLTAFIISLRNLQRSSLEGISPNVLEEGVRLVECMLQRVRDLAVELRPSMLDDLGLVATLRWYVDRQAQRAGFEADFSTDFVDLGLSPEQQTACFRVAQEALTNAVRHASPRRVQIRIQQKGADLELLVADDGVGFDIVAARERAIRGGSLGLLSMKERVELAGGRLHLESTLERGTVVRARFRTQAAVEIA